MICSKNTIMFFICPHEWHECIVVDKMSSWQKKFIDREEKETIFIYIYYKNKGVSQSDVLNFF